MTNQSFSRRDFLRQVSRHLTTASGLNLAYLLANKMDWAYAEELIAEKPGTASKAAYKLAPWTGDDFTQGHKLRNRDIPEIPMHAEREVEFVIVGGGMAGLASAYYLRDHNFLLLEQYDSFGGQSRGSSYNGIGYSYGAAYINTVTGLMGDLISDLKLTPAKLDPTKNSWRWENSWLAGVDGKDKVYAEFKKLLDNCKPIWKEMKTGIPVPVTSESLLKLDAVSFQDYLSGHSPAFTALIDAYLKSALCGGIGNVSALSAISTLEDLIEPTYVFPGGNPVMAKALEQKIKGPRCEKGFVWSVEVNPDGKSYVTYSGSDGKVHKVGCRHVIVTAPPMVAARIIHGISDKTVADLLSFKYGSYLVANILMPKKKFNGAYDNWVTPPYTFADITVAETPYVQQKKYNANMGSVLTIYQPYAPSSAGRPVLMQGDRQSLAESIVGQLVKLLGPIEKDIDTVALTRWGHAMAVTRPGFYSKISKLNGTTNSGYTLAHCSTQGIPCAESAVAAARLAANRALGKAARS